jgi:hypothetical protein
MSGAFPFEVSPAINWATGLKHGPAGFWISHHSCQLDPDVRSVRSLANKIGPLTNPHDVQALARDPFIGVDEVVEMHCLNDLLTFLVVRHSLPFSQWLCCLSIRNLSCLDCALMPNVMRLSGKALQDQLAAIDALPGGAAAGVQRGAVI